MIPSWFPELLEYFLVPLGVIVVAYGFNEQSRLKFSSGSDFFVFFVSLDLNALAVYKGFKGRINPALAADYSPVFVFLTLICLVLLGATLKTQGKIDRWRIGDQTRIQYPLTRSHLINASEG